MIDTPRIENVANLIGHAARAAMLTALKDDLALSATELASIAGVAPNTASEHLSKLVHAGLVEFESRGRHRLYRLARPEVADALESLEALGVATTPGDRLRPPADKAFRYARTCYDHLAGELGVNVTWSLVERGCLALAGDDFTVTKRGERLFRSLGVEMDSLNRTRRKTARRCRDWSEQRPHLGGALGAALLECFFARKWLRRRKDTRAVSLTPAGRDGLSKALALKL